MNVGEFLTQLATEHNTIAKVVAVIWYGAAAVVVFLVVTRRGWWKPTVPEIDWTTTANCPKCNEYGPYPWWERDVLLSSPERARDVHQAWHELTQAVFGPLERCIHRATQGRKPS